MMLLENLIAVVDEVLTPLQLRHHFVVGLNLG